MSELRLRSRGRLLAVGTAPDGTGWTATVDGATHRVEAFEPLVVATVGGATVEGFDAVIDGRRRRVVIARTRDRIHVAADGHAWVFEPVDDTQGGVRGAGSGAVVAPMPGKVVQVLVAAGDVVVAGQPLVVVEAMKMETTLTAEVDGTVTAVSAEVGAMVDAGAVVVEIASAEP